MLELSVCSTFISFLSASQTEIVKSKLGYETEFSVSGDNQNDEQKCLHSFQSYEIILSILLIGGNIKLTGIAFTSITMNLEYWIKLETITDWGQMINYVSFHSFKFKIITQYFWD